MTDFTLSHRNSRIPSVLRGIAKTISLYLSSIQAGLDARDAYERYSNMSDGALARHGLKREDIPGHVMRTYFAKQ